MAQGKGFGLSADLTSNNFEVLSRMIEEGTLPEARALMNGGICERIFTFAKQSLDGRCQASGQVSVEITAEDITMAMTRIPPPPRRDDGGDDDDGGGGGGGGGGDERLRLELTNVKQQLVLVKQQLRIARADSSRLKGELDRTKALLASRPAAPPPAARGPQAPQAPQAPPANQAPPAGAGHAAARAGVPAGGTWQVLLESGWATIDAAGQHIMNGAVAAGQTSIRDKIAGREYFIDFVAKKQTNCRTGKARDIRCAPAGSAVPASKPSEAGGIWQVLLNDGWKVMDAPTSATLSQAAQAGQTTVQLRQRGYDYTVDLAALTQTNLATKAVRQIKFV